MPPATHPPRPQDEIPAAGLSPGSVHRKAAEPASGSRDWPTAPTPGARRGQAADTRRGARGLVLPVPPFLVGLATSRSSNSSTGDLLSPKTTLISKQEHCPALEKCQGETAECHYAVRAVGTCPERAGNPRGTAEEHTIDKDSHATALPCFLGPFRGAGPGSHSPSQLHAGPSLSPHSRYTLRKATVPGLGRIQEEQTRGARVPAAPGVPSGPPWQHVREAQHPWATAPERVEASQTPRSCAAKSSAGIRPAESACLVHLPSCCGHRAWPWVFCPGGTGHSRSPTRRLRQRPSSGPG